MSHDSTRTVEKRALRPPGDKAMQAPPSPDPRAMLNGALRFSRQPIPPSLRGRELGFPVSGSSRPAA